jgi:hypothetical protein
MRPTHGWPTGRSPAGPSSRCSRQHAARVAAEQMRISPGTIYQSLFVQSRGELRRQLTAELRTGRSLRRELASRGTFPGSRTANFPRAGRYPPTGPNLGWSWDLAPATGTWHRAGRAARGAFASESWCAGARSAPGPYRAEAVPRGGRTAPGRTARRPYRAEAIPRRAPRCVPGRWRTTASWCGMAAPNRHGSRACAAAPRT